MTIKGNFKLIHDGFDFVKQRTNKQGNQTLWVCSKKRHFYCKGKALTRRIGAKEMVKLYDTHNHLPIDTDAEE